MTELLHHHLGRAVAAYPHRPAVSLGDQVLTYAELDRLSMNVAQLLCSAGLTPGDRVAIYQRKSIDMIVGLYGVLRAGCCFVPIDPKSPSGRVQSILQDCSVRAIVTDAAGYGVLETIDTTAAGEISGVHVVLHADEVTPSERLAAVAHHSWSAVSRADAYVESLPLPVVTLPVVSPDDLAYIMYTSGSTGPPKGMMHSHRSSLGFARWGERFCSLDEADVVANFSPLHFDISVFDLFSTMLGGGCVALVPESVQLFPTQVAKLLETSGTTVLFTVPFALTRLATMGALGDRDLSNVRWVLFGGEPFQPHDLAQLMDSLPNARYANVYGPAEAPACVVHEVANRPTGSAPLPIGQLAPGTTGHIVDIGSTDLVEPGTIGELLIDAPSITLGYWNRPDLNKRTREVIDGREFFRTGDLVVERANGLIDFIGRNDRMIKSRGFRIELDEVEAALASHPLVSEAAVFAVDGEGTKLVHAAVVSPGLDIAVLTEHLARRVPAYAIPVDIRVVSEMPRTTSDKIDRLALATAASDSSR